MIGLEYLPNHYTIVTEPNFQGKGNHNVLELEELLVKYKEFAHQQNIIKHEMHRELLEMSAELAELRGNAHNAPTTDNVINISEKDVSEKARGMQEHIHSQVEMVMEMKEQGVDGTETVEPGDIEAVAVIKEIALLQLQLEKLSIANNYTYKIVD